MKYLFYVLLSLVLITTACSSQNGLSKYKDTMIIFGMGGGYAGQVQEYQVKYNGTITKHNSIRKDSVEVAVINKKQLKKVYKGFEEYVVPNSKFNHPGNMSYFIKRLTGDKVDQVVWGDYEVEVPIEVKEYYNLLKSFVKKSKEEKN